MSLYNKIILTCIQSKVLRHIPTVDTSTKPAQLKK